MGMDVYGLNPKNAFGKIFRRNIWIWHPLWGYVEAEYPEIANKVKYGHSNDGDGLNENDSIVLSSFIASDLSNGKIFNFIDNEKNKYIDDPHRSKFVASYHDFRDFKDFLYSCGGFKIC
jgi:hypothetical protein